MSPNFGQFQSAFIAVARLTRSRTAQPRRILVSIRFHRGGPSHLVIDGLVQFSPLVSIRFHRGGPSHQLSTTF